VAVNGVTDVEVTQLDGGWRVSGCASGSYSIEVT
jgi:hypothetical protein